MPWTLAPIVLALAAATASPRTAPQITLIEGTVSTAPDGSVRATDGRAEALLADGTVLHIDRQTAVTIRDPYSLALGGGRVLLRTAPTAFIDVTLPIARVQLAPRGAYSILYDEARDSLLVTVGVGQADIHTRHGLTQVAGGEMAVMMGPASRPLATPFDPARTDSFEQWSARRMAMLASGAGSPGAVPAPAPAAAVGYASESSVTCSSWLSYDNPCWIVSPPVVLPPGAPGYTPTLPGYAPTYRPDYGPGFNPRPEPRPGVDWREPGLDRGRPPVREPGLGRRQPRPEPAPKSPGVKPVPRIVDPPKAADPPPPAASTPKPASGAAIRPPRS